MSTSSDETLLSMEEAIERLKTTRPTFYRWLRSGQIKGMKTGRQWRFYPADLDRFLKGEEPQIALPTSIVPLLEQLGQALQAHGQALPPGKQDAAQAISAMLLLARLEQAQSLHLEPVYLNEKDHQSVLRLRIDGGLRVVAQLDSRLLPPLLAQFKQRAHCDPQVHDQFQEGQFPLLAEETSGHYEAKLQFLPTSLGESLSLHLIGQQRHETISLEQIGLPPEIQAQVKRVLAAQWGMVIASGPTGSGKTTTLYAMLNAIAAPHLKTFALEDPPERYFPWVNSMALSPHASVAEQLRSVMKADPDVLLLNEIRDVESLVLSLNMALSGHMVLSVLHTQDAVHSLYRLLEVSKNGYTVTEAVKLILNQRLVRRLCPDCRQAAPPSAAYLERLQPLLSAHRLSPPSQVWQAQGCEACQHRGYRGRLQLTEALEITPEITQALFAEQSAESLRQDLLQQGWQTWLHDGWARAAAGETSWDELLRVQGS